MTTLNAGGQPALLGVDIGTSSAKVVITDLDGGLLSHASCEYSVQHAHPGWSEIAPDAWLTGVRVAARAAQRASSGVDVQAIGLSGQMHGVVPTTAAGAPVANAMVWSDSRAVAQLVRYHQLPAVIRRRLANPITPGMAGPMLAWLCVHAPETYRQMRWALQPKDWVRAQLTGEFWSEPSDASGTLLYDFSSDSWDADVVEALNLDPDILPEILPGSAEYAGLLDPSGAELLGLTAGIPVAAGAADTAAAALGSGLVAEGTVQLTIGSGAQIVTPIASPAYQCMTESPITHLYRAATRHRWYAMSAVISAGLSLTWVCDVLGASWRDLYATADLLPAPSDPFFLPHLNGERTPYLDADMRGAWTGLSPRHDRSRLLRAALEGVAFAIRDGVEALLDGTDVRQFRVAGGGSTNPAWRQLLADVLGRTLWAADVPVASGRGAALLGGQAAGLVSEGDSTGRSERTLQLAASPRDGHHQLVEDRYAQYGRLTRALRGCR